MKKAIAFLLALALVAGFAFAQEATLEDRVAALEKAAAKGYKVTGSVEFGIAGNTDDPLWNFSGTPAATVSGTGSIAYDSDKVAASVGFDLKPTITKTAAASQHTTTNKNSFDALKKLVAFRKAANTAYGLEGFTVAEQAGLDKYYPASVWVKASTIKTEADWLEVFALFDLIIGSTKAELLTILSDAGIAGVAGVSTSSSYYPFVDQFDNFMYYTTAWQPAIKLNTADQIAAAKKFIRAWKSFVKEVYGEIGTDSWAASYPVTSASFKFKSLFDVADLTMHVKGQAVSVGSMVTSGNSAQDTSDETPLGVTLGLASGLVENLSAGVLFNGFKAVAAKTENWQTRAIEADTATAHVFGLAANAGYALDLDMMKVSAGLVFGAKDLGDFANSYLGGLTVGFGMPDMFALKLDGEFNLLAGGGMGAGASLGANIMGIAPSAKVLWKNAAFGGDGTYSAYYNSTDFKTVRTDKVEKEKGYAAQFNSIDTTDALALSASLSVGTADLLGMKLATLSGGYDMMLVGGTESGWNAKLALDFAELLELPITLTGSASDWAANGLIYSVALGYTYDKVGITATYTSDAVKPAHTYSVLAKISF